MTPNAYLIPYRGLVALIFLLILFYFFEVEYYSRNVPAYIVRKSLLEKLGVTCFVLFAEALVYWRLREQIFSRLWAKWHVGLLYFSFLFLSLANIVIVSRMLSSPRSIGNVSSIRTTLYAMLISTFLYWAAILAAHVFFIVNILQSWKRKKQPVDEEEGLLDEFTQGNTD